MKKISKINWGLFKDSPKGQEAIAKFSKLSSADCSIEEMLSIAKSFSPLYFSNVTMKEEEGFLKILPEILRYLQHCQSHPGEIASLSGISFLLG